MKKIYSISAIILAIAMLFSGCCDVSKVKINLGTSEIFTQDELKDAANLILREMRGWDGVKEIYTIEYTGDKSSADNLAYCDSLAEGKSFTKCALFEASFKTKRHHTGGFNENDVYTGWQFFLAKTDGGAWEILTWGYC